MCYSILLHFVLIYLCFCNFLESYDSDNNNFLNEFVVQCPGGYSEAKSVAIQMGFILDHKMIGFDDFYVFKHKSNRNEKLKFHTHRLKRSTKITWVEQQVKLKRVKRDFKRKKAPITFIDPLYELQWYLMRSQHNTGQIDMNVIEAWKLGYTGKNVVISILDDGIDYRHDDLAENYDPSASYDINGGDNDPLPNLLSLDNRHGTRCAGEVSAKANNSKCGIGVAYNSKIGAVRMLDGEVTDRVEAEALSFKQQHIDIYSGSWGPDDNGKRVEGPAILAKSAFERGTNYGRNGLGNIYVWASGNGGKKLDSCACDGYASSIHTVSISSVSELNRKPWYLESCASTLASTYSSGSSSEKKIISTDLNNMCATDHTGTSASAPLAAGIIALLIEANRNLTWRDVQYIIVATSNPEPFENGNFIINGANRKVSNLYGFGLMDTGKMVRLGRLWNTLPPQHVCMASYNGEKKSLQGKFKVKLTIETDGCGGKNKVNYVEHVILYVTVEYQRRGDLRIHLISPSGTRSEILPYRPFDFFNGPATFDTWPLMSVQFWGESSAGLWSIEIDNSKSMSTNLKGLLSSFKLEFYGTDKWPMRLKPPGSSEPDNWFQKFERFVVTDIDETVPTKPHASVRTHADTSDKEIVKEIFECDEECFNNTCTGIGPQFCESCTNYIGFNKVCVAKCPLGSYVKANSKICEPCHFSCDECFGPGRFNCSRCHVGDAYVSETKQCQMSLHGCPAGYFNDSKKCQRCSENCAVCMSSTQCSKCNQSFLLTLQSQCRSKCDIGSYADNRNNCRVCHMDCLSCIKGDSASCTSCNHDSFINSLTNTVSVGKCVYQCPYGYYTNHTVGFCYKCHRDCKTCTGPSSEMCTDCVPPMELSETGNTCIDPVSYNCRPNEFKSSIGTCKKCPVDCQTCVENGCTSCLSDKKHLNKKCVRKCPTGYFLLTKSNTCLPCVAYCNFCDSSISNQECNQCPKNFTVCNRNCSAGEYWNVSSKICTKCHHTCKTCTGNSEFHCASCRENSQSISFGKCLGSCPFGEYSLQLNKQRICIPCNPSCHNSSCNAESGKCLHCPYGYILSSSGLCERRITCSISEYWHNDQKKCLKCDPSCRSCSQERHCSSCDRSYCLDLHTSTCKPCCSPFSTNKNCSLCSFNQELCMDESHLKFPQISLILFQYPVRILVSMSLVFLIIFFLIFSYLYAGNIFLFFKFNKTKLFMTDVKYQKISSSLDDVDGTVLSSDEEEIQFKRTKISTNHSDNLNSNYRSKTNAFVVSPASESDNIVTNGHVSFSS